MEIVEHSKNYVSLTVSEETETNLAGTCNSGV